MADTKRIKPDEVVAAYCKTGMGVIQGEYISSDMECACGMGVYAVANLGVVPADCLEVDDDGDACNNGVITAALLMEGFCGDYHDGFAVGFDGDRYFDEEVERKTSDWKLGRLDGMAAYAAVEEARLV